MPRPMDANQLPDELLELILSFVPARALVTCCRLVCHRWRDLTRRPTLWKLQWERDPVYRAALESAGRAPGLDWAWVSVVRPLERNLVKNPGEEKHLHWNGRLSQTTFLSHKSTACGGQDGPESSYCHCQSSESQLVSLLEEGLWEDLLDSHQPDIVISDWWDSLRPTGCEYSIEVALLAGNQTSVIMEFKAHQNSASPLNAAGYREVSHVFRNYGPGVRYVRFWHEGTEAGYWSGRFGIRFMNASVVVKMSWEPL